MQLTEEQKLTDAVFLVSSCVPGFNLKLKSESWTQRQLGKVLGWLGSKDYMTDVWTTFGSTVYRPIQCDRGVANNEWQIILHEGRHANDAYKMGVVLFSFLYLAPQSLGILGSLALLVLALVGCLSAWWCLLPLALLAPLPAIARAYLEARAYLVSMATDFWSKHIEDEEAYLDWLVFQYVSGTYYWMMPFESLVRSYFRYRLEQLKLGTLELDSYLMACRTKTYTYNRA
jgi:hypothetical protein